MFYQTEINALCLSRLSVSKLPGNDPLSMSLDIDSVDARYFELLKTAICNNELQNSTDFIVSPMQHSNMLLVVPKIYLSTIAPNRDYVFTGLGQCQCKEVVGDHNRKHLSEIREIVENRLFASFKEDENYLSVTFACSGMLLSEFSSLLRLFESIKDKDFVIEVNFIDTEYLNFIKLQTVRELFLQSFAQAETESEPAKSELSKRCDRTFFVIQQLFSEKLNLHTVSVFDFLKLTSVFIKKDYPKIRVLARFFSAMQDYEFFCMRSKRCHDLLIGQDVPPIWGSLSLMHRISGNITNLAIAWSKKFEPDQSDPNSKLITLELKEMKNEEQDWTQIGSFFCSAPIASSSMSASSSTSSTHEPAHADSPHPATSSSATSGDVDEKSSSSLPSSGSQNLDILLSAHPSDEIVSISNISQSASSVRTPKPTSKRGGRRFVQKGNGRRGSLLS
jgi:hypothetical protein